MTAKEQLITTVTQWLDAQIDFIVAEKPNLSVFASRIKQGAHNYLAKNEDKIDNALLFVTDEKGNLDVDDMFTETIRVFDETPITTKSVMGFDVSIGKGEIEVALPDNFLVNMFMGETNSLKITSADFLELKNMIVESQKLIK